MRNTSVLKYLLLYLPYFASIAIEDTVISYIIAWLGSFYIFYMSMSGRIKPLPNDVSIYEQLLRPLFLVQLVFAGYMATTSIFFFLSSLGYTYFTYTGSQSYNPDIILSIAECQQYYLLGHAALVTGILLVMDYPVRKNTYVQLNDVSGFLLKLGVLTFPLSFVFKSVPGLDQFSLQCENLGFVACALSLATSLAEKNKKITVISVILFGLYFIKATVSGYKEPVIVSVLLLGIFLIPVYGKKLIMVFIPILIGLITILPTYVSTFRTYAWSEGADANEAKEAALDALKNTEKFAETNWAFLTIRISEISMFIQFHNDVPVNNNFYGLEIVKQSLFAIVPRVFWPSKPITENIVMERAYRSNVVDPQSFVSAKPATVVDGYLSGGSLGVFISLFIYGLLAQLIALRAEKLFGGFLLGTALVFTGLFQVFWRGNSFEFLINNMFWSYIGMLILNYIFKRSKILVPVS